MFSEKKSFIQSLLVLALSSLITCEAQADSPADQARVIVEGRILDTPCSIAPGSREQTISMGAMPMGIIAHSGVGRPVPFTIRLVDCALERFDSRLPVWRGVSVIFDGVSDGGDFAVSGTAGGVALRILDANGDRAHPGESLPGGLLMRGDQELGFIMQLVVNHQPLLKGDYWATIHFGLSYF